MFESIFTIVFGLRGKVHPAITNVVTTHEVKKMRPHVKMLAENYLTFEEKSQQSGGSPNCRLCNTDDDGVDQTKLTSRQLNT